MAAKTTRPKALYCNSWKQYVCASKTCSHSNTNALNTIIYSSLFFSNIFFHKLHKNMPRLLSTCDNKWDKKTYFNTYLLDGDTDSLWTFLENMDYIWPAQFYAPAIICHRMLMLRPLNPHDRINFESQRQCYPRRKQQPKSICEHFMHVAHMYTWARWPICT